MLNILIFDINLKFSWKNIHRKHIKFEDVLKYNPQLYYLLCYLCSTFGMVVVVVIKTHQVPNSDERYRCFDLFDIYFKFPYLFLSTKQALVYVAICNFFLP